MCAGELFPPLPALLGVDMGAATAMFAITLGRFLRRRVRLIVGQGKLRNGWRRLLRRLGDRRSRFARARV